MSTLNEVYQKFGEVSEAAQLLETELGNVLLKKKIVDKELIEKPNKKIATELFEMINSSTLGKLIKEAKGTGDSINNIEDILEIALYERNRLSHYFFRQHNFRRNSEEGRKLMMNDLNEMHLKIIEAFKAVSLISGTDLDKILITILPEKHLHI